MKIGVILLAYNTSEYVDKCLSSWVKLRSKYDITIGCVNGMFKEYIELGIKPEKNKSTLKKLINHDIDYLISTGEKTLVDENFARNFILNLIKKETDIVWILDCDEFYTEYDIENILNYVNTTPDVDWYSINFKNYIFTNKLFVSGFCPPRIFRTDRNGGINQFYFDNHINYNDGSDLTEHLNLSIPRNFAWVNHFSWISDDPRTPDKIKYQNYRFDNGCNFKWNYEFDCLQYDEEYFTKLNEEKPVLTEEINIFSHDFTLNFTRPENTFFVRDVCKTQTITIKTFNGHNNRLLNTITLSLTENINYFYNFPHENFYLIDNFNKFRIEVFNDIGELIHNQFLHIK